MRETVLDVRGHALKLREHGDGPPLLFLHGAGGASWTPLLERLSTRYRVLAPEHPGFSSAPPEWLSNVGDLAFFYLDVMDKLSIGKLHLVGHSLGGWTAAEIAIRSTARLTSLVLMAPAGLTDPAVPYGDIFAWTPEQAARNQMFDQKLAEERMKARATQPKGDGAQHAKHTVRRLAFEPRLANPQLRFWIHRIDVPTLFVWGRDDKIVPHALNAQWLPAISNARLATIPACGHASHTEKPDAAADAITSFHSALR